MHNNLEEYLPLLIEELSDPDSDESIDTRWKSILERFYSGSSLSMVNGHLEQCVINSDSSILSVPAIEQQGIYQLTANSNKVFEQNDVQLADALLKLARQFVSVQDAIEQGASAERQRIARDLHDDVAARMLTLIHQVKDKQSIDLARSILKSLRNAIYTLDNKSTTTIQDAVTDIRAEVQERLNTIGIQLFWTQPDNLTEYHFTPRQHINLHRILHETATNVIRHAEAQYMTVDIELDGNTFRVFACDNGKGFNMDDCIPGKGINNITNRVKELKGEVHWIHASETEAQRGSCLDIRFPISIKKAN